MRKSSRAGRQNGFTLIELLIVLSVLGILMGALAMSLRAMLAQTSATESRVEVSADAQTSAAYFSDDVAATGVRDSAGNAVQSIETNASPTGGLYPCGASTLPNATVRLAWDELTDTTSAGRTRVVVSYVVVTSSAERQLRRVVCRVTPAPSSPTTTTPIANEVVARNVSAVTTPALSCSSSCTAATPPKRVNLTLTIAKPGTADVLTVTLTGLRRQT